MAKDKEDPKDKAPALVRMVRPGPKPPTTADVHPAEVENFKAGGWQIVKETKE